MVGLGLSAVRFPLAVMGAWSVPPVTHLSLESGRVR